MIYLNTYPFICLFGSPPQLTENGLILDLILEPDLNRIDVCENQSWFLMVRQWDQNICVTVGWVINRRSLESGADLLDLIAQNSNNNNKRTELCPMSHRVFNGHLKCQFLSYTLGFRFCSVLRKSMEPRNRPIIIVSIESTRWIISLWTAWRHKTVWNLGNEASWSQINTSRASKVRWAVWDDESLVWNSELLELGKGFIDLETFPRMLSR